MSNRFLSVRASSGPTRDSTIELSSFLDTYLCVNMIERVALDRRKVSDGKNTTERDLVRLEFAHTGVWLYVIDMTPAEVIHAIEERIHCEMDYARTGTAHLGPPPPVRLGSGGSENNQAVAEIKVADIDLYPVLRFTGRSGADAAKALVSEQFSVEVPVFSLGVASTPLPSKSAHLTGPAGTVLASRSGDGTVLYLLGEDSAAAFGFTVEGVPS
ncbi:MAG: hypothetical protein F4X04_14580 [Holophagales bacterium]|nr:hypothetical protein [Holophagales bacterium]MYD23442.1 hypothetical protein [Holophagales bacterium]